MDPLKVSECSLKQNENISIYVKVLLLTYFYYKILNVLRLTFFNIYDLPFLLYYLYLYLDLPFNIYDLPNIGKTKVQVGLLILLFKIWFQNSSKYCNKK